MGILFGGAMCALSGAYMSICYAPMWQENMTAGRGWIALSFSCICYLEAKSHSNWSLYFWRSINYANESCKLLGYLFLDNFSIWLLI